MEVRPSTVVIIGAGTVGEFAARAAMGLGAEVKVFDNRQHRLVRIQQSLGRRIWTSTIQPSVLDEALRTADVAIGALRGEGPRSPMVVSEPMVSAMGEKSVIIDVCIDRGGCFETSRITSREDPTYTELGVIHYCVPNLASAVSRTASEALSNIIAPMLLSIALDGGVENAVRSANMIRSGVYMFKGTLTHKGIAEEEDYSTKNWIFYLPRTKHRLQSYLPPTVFLSREASSMLQWGEDCRCLNREVYLLPLLGQGRRVGRNSFGLLQLDQIVESLMQTVP